MRECLLSAVNPKFLLEQIANGYQTVMPFDMLSEMMRSGSRTAFRQFELFALDHAGTSENIGWISNELRGGVLDVSVNGTEISGDRHC